MQDHTGDEVHLFLKKKLNVVVLVVGLILCLVPGLAYLIWYSTADQNQAITVKIGDAPNIGGYHPDEEADAASDTTGAGALAGAAPAAPLPGPSGPPAQPVPPTPAAEPVPPVSETPPMPPAAGDTPPPAPPPPPQSF